MKILDRDSLPPALKPLTNRQLAICLVICMAALTLAGCGGGHQDDDRKADPTPNCAMRPEACK